MARRCRGVASGRASAAQAPRLRGVSAGHAGVARAHPGSWLVNHGRYVFGCRHLADFLANAGLDAPVVAVDDVLVRSAVRARLFEILPVTRVQCDEAAFGYATRGICCSASLRVLAPSCSDARACAAPAHHASPQGAACRHKRAMRALPGSRTSRPPASSASPAISTFCVLNLMNPTQNYLTSVPCRHTCEAMVEAASCSQKQMSQARAGGGTAARSRRCVRGALPSLLS